jgi:polar amino acid transport system substrate-binding protein
MNRHTATFTMLLAALVALAACTTATTQPPQPTTEPDLLADITARGYIRVSTDPNYAPQSVLKADGQRTAGTRCPSDMLTAGELEGFDIDVAVELGRRLGVETCFVTPSWDSITAGNWGNQWDVSVGSMTITTARQQVLHFTTPYYYTPAQFAAATSAGISSLADLNGQSICVGAATTYESWLNGDLEELGLPASSLYAEAPTGVTVVPLDTDQECAQAIAAGRTDFAVYLTSATVVEQNIEQGVPVAKVGSPVFSEDLSVAVDKSHRLAPVTLVSQLDAAVKAMHADGTLSQLSLKWFGEDLSQAPQ